MIVAEERWEGIRKGSDVLERLVCKLIELIAERRVRFEEIDLGPLEDGDFVLNRSCPAVALARPKSSPTQDAGGTVQTVHQATS